MSTPRRFILVLSLIAVTSAFIFPIWNIRDDEFHVFYSKRILIMSDKLEAIRRVNLAIHYDLVLDPSSLVIELALIASVTGILLLIVPNELKSKKVTAPPISLPVQPLFNSSSLHLTAIRPVTSNPPAAQPSEPALVDISSLPALSPALRPRANKPVSRKPT